MSMEKSDTNGNRTRDLPVCGAVPQPLQGSRAEAYSLLYIHHQPFLSDGQLSVAFSLSSSFDKFSVVIIDSHRQHRENDR
jgi:hypothetical protein